MDRHFTIINPERFAKAIHDMQCGKTSVAELNSEDFAIEAFEINPPEGFKAPEKFPLCCPAHEQIFQSVKDWYDKFPNCCAFHRKLNKATWFKKSQYAFVPTKVSNQLVYTGNVIRQKLDNDDWYEDITDYIEYNYASFGQLPAGYGTAPGLKDYLGFVLQEFKKPSLEKLVEAPDKTKRLLEFVSNYYKEKAKAKVDFNQLITTYKNWLKIFPFDTIYFKQLKSFFAGQIPILKGKPATNRYLKTATVSVKTQNELIEWLVDTTKVLLKSVNSAELVKNKHIPDAKKHAIDLIGENHRIKQDTLLMEFRKGELAYVKVLKAWINNEKKYFKELVPLLKRESIKTPKVQYPPVSEDVFEDLVTDLFNAQYPEARFSRFGKKGNGQKGIDILSTVRQEAIQCKKKDLSRRANVIKNDLTKDFEADIRRAMELNIEIGLLIFASTFEDNAALEERLQEIKEKLKPKFKVSYMGWTSLSGSLHQFPELIEKYYN